WLIGVAVLGLALIGVGTWAYISRQRAQSALSAASARAEQLAALGPLEGRTTDARRHLVADHFNVAADAFAQVAVDAKNRQPLYGWARLQQGLSAMVGRKTTRAKEAFEEVEKAG